MKTEKTYASEKAKHNIFYLLLGIYSFRSESSKEKKIKEKVLRMITSRVSIKERGFIFSFRYFFRFAHSIKWLESRIF